jgi:hypothetical protein
MLRAILPLPPTPEATLLKLAGDLRQHGRARAGATNPKRLGAVPPPVLASPISLALSQKDSQAGSFWALLWLNAGEANGHGRQAANFHGRRQQTGQTPVTSKTDRTRSNGGDRALSLSRLSMSW